MSLEWFAVASPGLEGVLAEELAALPEIGQTRAVAGGVEFAGPLAAGMAANLASRIATRILLRVGEVRARDFASLRRGLAKLAWRSFIPNDSPLRIDVTASHCRLYHTGALADTLALAVEDCLGKLPRREKGSVADEGRACTRLLLRGQDDRFLASVDSSGDLLHRRGWRIEAGPAPLRETLAAGILALCDYDPALSLVDPMCGSGTVAIEAAAVARALAPGGGRSFAFERWPTHDEGIWRKVRALRAGHARAPAQIFASDRDPRAVEMARRNAKRAGVATDIQFAVAAFGKGAIPATPGLVVLNPPYGHRLEKRGNARRLARGLGQDLASCYRGWRAAVLCPDAVFVAAVSAGARRQPDKTFALRNGGLRVRLGVWSL
ncbi:MAG: class I SAM-dependent RNA methyltransferase [Deltaproteobacteria bacterium]|nr:class I SAM-dependent RNA methyltransferase [Deltaproteobacteria bacterium]